MSRNSLSLCFFLYWAVRVLLETKEGGTSPKSTSTVKQLPESLVLFTPSPYPPRHKEQKTTLSGNLANSGLSFLLYPFHIALSWRRDEEEKRIDEGKENTKQIDRRRVFWYTTLWRLLFSLKGSVTQDCVSLSILLSITICLSACVCMILLCLRVYATNTTARVTNSFLMGQQNRSCRTPPIQSTDQISHSSNKVFFLRVSSVQV